MSECKHGNPLYQHCFECEPDNMEPPIDGDYDQNSLMPLGKRETGKSDFAGISFIENDLLPDNFMIVSPNVMRVLRGEAHPTEDLIVKLKDALEPKN